MAGGDGKKLVYVFKPPGGGPVKIGVSGNVASRLRALNQSRSDALEIVSISERRADAKLVERLAHTLLEEKRVRGEWFDVTCEEAAAAVEDAIRRLDADASGSRPRAVFTQERYRQFLRTHGLTQVEFAGLLGHSPRAGQYWATEAVSPAAATVAALIERRPELLTVLREIAAERTETAR